MAHRTITRNDPAVMLDEGGVQFPSPDLQEEHPVSIIMMRVGSTTKTGLHWHEAYTGE